MSADAAPLAPDAARDLHTVRVYRYAVGTTLAVAVAMAIQWPLSYLAPVLALSFLATPDPCPGVRAGVGWITAVAAASLFGFLLGQWLLDFPVVHLLVSSLILFRVFHAKTGGASPVTG